MIILIILTIFFAIILIFCIYFLTKKEIFCDNLILLNNLMIDKKIKYKYKTLDYSFTNLDIEKLFNRIIYPTSFQSEIIDNKNYLLTISKFIDYKINNCKLTFRTKNSYTILENLAYIISLNIYKDYPYRLFDDYLKNYSLFQIKIKENNYFKILLAKNLICILIKISTEMNYISNIIHKYKKRKFLINYKKNIYNYAKFYAILKYNPNSNYYYFKKNLNSNAIFSNLFSSLAEAEHKTKIILTYLKTMF